MNIILDEHKQTDTLFVVKLMIENCVVYEYDLFEMPGGNNL